MIAELAQQCCICRTEAVPTARWWRLPSGDAALWACSTDCRDRWMSEGVPCAPPESTEELEPGACPECRQVKPLRACGVCSACIVWRWRHPGTQRPLGLTPCPDCGTLKPARQARCRPCYIAAWRRGGVAATDRPRRGVRVACQGGCGQLRPPSQWDATGRCLACYLAYQREAGRQRATARPLKPCAHCHELRRGLRRGLCATCDWYQRHHGEPRPDALIQRARAQRQAVGA